MDKNVAVTTPHSELRFTKGTISPVPRKLPKLHADEHPKGPCSEGGLVLPSPAGPGHDSEALLADPPPPRPPIFLPSGPLRYPGLVVHDPRCSDRKRSNAPEGALHPRCRWRTTGARGPPEPQDGGLGSISLDPHPHAPSTLGP